MKDLYFILLVLLFSCHLSKAQDKEQQKVIFDTDIGPDYDDVGALAMLHNLADSNEVSILATISCNHHFLTGPTLHLLNTHANRPNIPIGVPSAKGLSLTTSLKWPQMLLQKYPHKYNSNDDFPSAISVYRKVLSEATDKSVVIVAVGFLTNLSDLLNSKSDEFSELSGHDLVAKKAKLLVSMAGKFPVGREYNVYMDNRSSQNVIRNWPTKIIFSGWEIGNEIRTGLKLIANNKIKNSPFKDAYSHSMPQRSIDSLGRMSWDQTAVLVGVRGVSPYFGVKRGIAKIGDDGQNYWQDDNLGKHFYLVQDMDYKTLTDIIEDLMMR